MCQLLTFIRRTAGVVCLGFMASSCSDPPPTALPAAPTPITSAVTPPTPPPVSSITGVVTDESGNPITGATVTAHLRDMPVRALTNSQGEYGIDVPQPNYLIFAVTAERVGYERNEQVVRRPEGAGLGPVIKNFRLYPVDSFVAGASRRLTITSNDSLCAVLDVGGTDHHWFCRTFRVQAVDAGTLVLEVVPDGPAGTGELWTHPAPYYRCCGPRHSFSVPAGTEAQVTVMTALERVPQTFTLNTSLHPE
jgi:carboxypeptidase family protein